jgi:hypothetical protein
MTPPVGKKTASMGTTAIARKRFMIVMGNGRVRA